MADITFYQKPKWGYGIFYVLLMLSPCTMNILSVVCIELRERSLKKVCTVKTVAGCCRDEVLNSDKNDERSVAIVAL